MINYVEV